jgi:hypothetical protein
MQTARDWELRARLREGEVASRLQMGNLLISAGSIKAEAVASDAETKTGKNTEIRKRPLAGQSRGERPRVASYCCNFTI